MTTLSAEQKIDLRILSVYLMGVVDAAPVGPNQVFNPKVELPWFLNSAAVGLLKAAADDAPLAQAHKWHSAANTLNAWVRQEGRSITAGYEYPESIPTGDWSHAAFMRVAEFIEAVEGGK